MQHTSINFRTNLNAFESDPDHCFAALKPASLDHVIFFGQAPGITEVPGWHRDWQQPLVQVKQGEWGVVYRIR